jgi:hypothetical protein
MSAAAVYLLHFASRHPAGRRPQHYAGVSRADSFEKRMEEHRRGNPGKGGALPRSFAALGVAFDVARRWNFEEPNSAFAFERSLKRGKHLSRQCPLCSGGLFRVSYDDEGERRTEEVSFLNTGSISALEWAEDYAYRRADKGPYKIERREQGRWSVVVDNLGGAA